MQDGTILASVHRFREHVAVSFGNGPTVYITPKDAEVFAHALNSCAENIKTQPDFCKSSFGTCFMEFRGKIG